MKWYPLFLTRRLGDAFCCYTLYLPFTKASSVPDYVPPTETPNSMPPKSLDATHPHALPYENNPSNIPPSTNPVFFANAAPACMYGCAKYAPALPAAMSR